MGCRSRGDGDDVLDVAATGPFATAVTEGRCCPAGQARSERLHRRRASSALPATPTS
jgi:hypothetical protein